MDPPAARRLSPPICSDNTVKSLSISFSSVRKGEAAADDAAADDDGAPAGAAGAGAAKGAIGGNPAVGAAGAGPAGAGAAGAGAAGAEAVKGAIGGNSAVGAAAAIGSTRELPSTGTEETSIEYAAEEQAVSKNKRRRDENFIKHLLQADSHLNPLKSFLSLT